MSQDYLELGFDIFMRKDKVDIFKQITLSESNQVLSDWTIADDQVVDLNVKKLVSGTINSQSIVMGVTADEGDVEIRSGISTGDFANADANSGFIFGIDDSDSDKVKFYWGSPTSFIKFDGTDVTVSTPVTVDETFTAGEDLTAREAVGLWGEILDETDAYHNADEATYVSQDNPTTIFDGTSPILCHQVAEKWGLVHFPSLPAIPSGGGKTNLKIEIRFKCNYPNDQNPLVGGDLTAGFNEATVNWNTKPGANNDAFGIFGAGSGTGVRETAYFVVTESQYNNIRSNGMVFNSVSTNARMEDEDDGTQPPTLKARFTYKIQDGKIYKVNDTDGTGDGEGTNYPDSFVGLVVANASVDASVIVRTEGKMTGFSGLTPYTVYYLASTDGEIDTSNAAPAKIVGRSLSTTELQIKYILT